MKVAIIGLPKSGKTTIFNTLTKGNAEVTAYSASLSSNVGIARVPDTRLDTLSNAFHPKKTTPAEVNYVDIGGSLKQMGNKGEMSGELLNYLTTADALLQVVRLFTDEQIPHPEGSIDAERDIGTMDMELAFSDLAIIERRLNKIGSALKGAKSPERENYQKEQVLLKKIKIGLDQDIPIRQQKLDAAELKALSHYQFLTAKPMLVVLNIGENQLPAAEGTEEKLLDSHPEFAFIALCGKLEMELSQLDESSAVEFRETMGLTESALGRVIQSTYKLLGLCSFFTTGPDEVKAWTITQGLLAQQAAGKVHSDIERGFIRAEVLSYRDFIECGSFNEAKRKGLLRTEGKTYVVQDGDIINYLFNI